MFQLSPFSSAVAIPQDAQVIFVSDLFVEDYVGGAELTTQALIDACPLKIHKLKSRYVSLELLKKGVDRFWIFGNFAELDPQLIPTIIANMHYAIVEYDYKYCRYRSPEKHAQHTGSSCDCHEQMNGKLVSAFFYGSMGLWWMSEKQKQHYHSLFPFLASKDNVILSSVFSDVTIGKITHLAQMTKPQREGWIVLGSNSWVKGADDAEKWCKDNDKKYEVVWNMPYDEVLAKLATAEGFVYLPKGADTCPRMVIEAKLLGCKLELNDNVQHKDEEWFATDDVDGIKDYLYASKKLFWNGIKHAMEYKPTISGYTTTYNCISQKYPFEESIQSMLQFCDEVCVVDGGSTDGTWEELEKMQLDDKYFVQSTNEKRLVSKLKVRRVERDWNHPRFALFDGMQKAEARKMCTKEFCWQMDSDEVMHEDDVNDVVEMCRRFPQEIDVVALPVVEYWGGPQKVRIDVNPWKWRLSRNRPYITHGVPKTHRLYDENGEMYASEGTDGCDIIHAETHEPVPFVGFYTPQADHLRRLALIGDQQALHNYETWLNDVVNTLPTVFHYSWYDLPRKIRLYRDYWAKHWYVLYDKNNEDTAENNMMFDVPWSEVTEEMIEARAAELAQETGGWIWHRKWDGRKTPHAMINRMQPALMSKK